MSLICDCIWLKHGAQVFTTADAGPTMAALSLCLLQLGRTYCMVDSITVSQKQKTLAKATKLWVGVQVKRGEGTGTTTLLGGTSTVMDAAAAGAAVPVPTMLLVPVSTRREAK
jgi:hypothetical protein